MAESDRGDGARVTEQLPPPSQPVPTMESTTFEKAAEADKPRPHPSSSQSHPDAAPDHSNLPSSSSQPLPDPHRHQSHSNLPSSSSQPLPDPHCHQSHSDPPTSPPDPSICQISPDDRLQNENTVGSTVLTTVDEEETSVSMPTKQLSHVEALRQAKELILGLLSDPLLSDLPRDVSVDEARSVLALEQGKAITLHLRRFDGTVLPIIVLQGARVGDLMKAIERKMTRKCIKEGATSHLSWRYVWKTYWLAHRQQRLEDRNRKLVAYGITNQEEVSFVPRLRRESKAKRKPFQTYT